MKKLLAVILLAMFCICSTVFAQFDIGDGDTSKLSPEQRTALDSARAALLRATGQTNVEADSIYQERRGRGDTIALDDMTLQNFLPDTIPGYRCDGPPDGSTVVMEETSISNVVQNYASGRGRRRKKIRVEIIDFGGSPLARGMMMPLMMELNSEDAHQRFRSMKLDLPYTFGYQQYSKDTKEANAMIGTRYRYLVTVGAANQKEDQTDLVMQIATEIARKFEGK
jgi:hypothetical protein